MLPITFAADLRPNARLVIVDTLAVVRPQQKSTDSTYSGDYAALRGLHQIASKNNMAVMVVHHLRKADAEEVPGHPQRSAVLMVDYCA